MKTSCAGDVLNAALQNTRPIKAEVVAIFKLILASAFGPSQRDRFRTRNRVLTPTYSRAKSDSGQTPVNAHSWPPPDSEAHSPFGPAAGGQPIVPSCHSRAIHQAWTRLSRPLWPDADLANLAGAGSGPGFRFPGEVVEQPLRRWRQCLEAKRSRSGGRLHRRPNDGPRPRKGPRNCEVVPAIRPPGPIVAETHHHQRQPQS